MAKHGKKYLSALAQVDRFKEYGPQEAIALAKSLASAQFDETIEVHLRMNVNPRRADQQIRSTVALPAGTGKTLRILVFAEGDAARLAEEAGADYVGADDLVARIQEGWVDFDVAVAVPQVMGKIGRLGRVLGPRGLMPSPKAGTVVQPEDIAGTVQQLRQGRVEFRIDRSANLHIPIGKASFTEEQLLQNLAAVMDAVQRVRPEGLRGQYFRRITVASTMGPGLHLSVPEAIEFRA